MFGPKGLLLSSALVTLVTCAVVKVPPEAEWTKAAPKTVYSRALGPPSPGMGTITVPYMPKSPFFPKFVDPTKMIAMKTDILKNLFGGLGPAMYGPDMAPVMTYGVGDSTQPILSTTDEKGENPVKDSLSAPWLESPKIKANDESSLLKRGIFGPFTPPFGGMGSKFGMGPKFGPMGPKFNPMSQFASPDMTPDYSMKDSFSRKRRSVDTDSVPSAKDLGPPPAYPTLEPIFEEPDMEANELQSKPDMSTVPKEYLPGMFGPFAPVVDPSMFIAKKYAFLDTLFKNIATSTATPTTTVTPEPKSTIVPPSFWFPTSVIPGPTDYDTKVSEFLDKLFDTLKLNKTAPPEIESPKTESPQPIIKSDVATTEERISRSIEDLSSISAAKDTIADTILSELGDIKSDMMTTMNDLITYQKTAASMMPKKAFKPFASGAFSKSTMDVTLPFKQRMAILGQVFDMLTELQKNITSAVDEAIKTSSAANKPDLSSQTNIPSSADIFSGTSNDPINLTLLDALKTKLATPIEKPSGVFGPSSVNMMSKTTRMLPQSPTSFWVSYPGAETVKRQVDENSLDADVNEESNTDRKQFTRAVKMQMHQGYQSLPAGSIESVQAGGGSTPDHQGGGIRLLDAKAYGDVKKWFDWTPYVQNEHQGHRHNHNHH